VDFATEVRLVRLSEMGKIGDEKRKKAKRKQIRSRIKKTGRKYAFVNITSPKKAIMSKSRAYQELLIFGEKSSQESPTTVVLIEEVEMDNWGIGESVAEGGKANNVG
jgi:hypothetical protein